MRRDRFSTVLKNGLRKIGLKEDSLLIEKLWRYMNFLIEENKKYNLTAIENEEEIISKHFLDSLVLFTKYKIDNDKRIIDIGTGAGFPGLVLKIYKPGIEMVLLDSLNKRINFLNILIEKLDLENISTKHVRAEELGREKDFREKYDFVVSRAVASINILSEYTIPFSVVGGKIIFFKGPDYQKEIDEGLKAVEIMGGEITNIFNVEVPGVQGERFLVEITKIKETPGKYPRKPGLPKKRPL